jgi:hypothetical protein
MNVRIEFMVNEDEINRIIFYDCCKYCEHGPNSLNNCLSPCDKVYNLLKVGFKKDKLGNKWN